MGDIVATNGEADILLWRNSVDLQYLQYILGGKVKMFQPMR